MISTTIDLMIKKLINNCIKWVIDNGDDTYFIDPNDNVEVSNHYGATHIAASLIIYGNQSNQPLFFQRGVDLLESLLRRWSENCLLAGYHADFNNFALCVVFEYLNKEKICEDLQTKIKEVIIKSADSNNPTINWIPMRWYVNNCRYVWTGENRYHSRCVECIKQISDATYDDGHIDDRLPKGTSFNLQYDVSTVAVMQYINCHCGHNVFDLSKPLAALLLAAAPDGDINYYGRGTNQVFAWGVWIYLLSSSANKELLTAIDYLDNHLDAMISNNNMMLNKWEGSEKYMWWDYHYCSVYEAHLVFWLLLAKLDYEKSIITPTTTNVHDSGFVVNKNSNFFVPVFSGRKEYLAERGPVIAMVWSRKYGVLYKGSFGPWKGHFGKKYASEDVTLRNFLGLLEVRSQLDFSNRRILDKLFKNKRFREYEEIRPYFSKVDVSLGKELEITFDYNGSRECVLNFPVFYDSPIYLSAIRLFVDGRAIELHNDIVIRNQYGWLKVFQNRPIHGKKWVLRVLCDGEE